MERDRTCRMSNFQSSGPSLFQRMGSGKRKRVTMYFMQAHIRSALRLTKSIGALPMWICYIGSLHLYGNPFVSSLILISDRMFTLWLVIAGSVARHQACRVHDYCMTFPSVIKEYYLRSNSNCGAVKCQAAAKIHDYKVHIKYLQRTTSGQRKRSSRTPLSAEWFNYPIREIR